MRPTAQFSSRSTLRFRVQCSAVDTGRLHAGRLFTTMTMLDSGKVIPPLSPQQPGMQQRLISSMLRTVMRPIANFSSHTTLRFGAPRTKSLLLGQRGRRAPVRLAFKPVNSLLQDLHQVCRMPEQSRAHRWSQMSPAESLPWRFVDGKLGSW